MESGRDDAIFSTEVAHDEVSLSSLATRIVSEAGTKKLNPLHIIREYTTLAAGAGKISPGDFLRLRLFDKDFYGNADLREFVGDRRMRDITLAVNFRRDWYALLSNKIASIGYLNAFGLPTPPVRAIYAPSMGSSHGTVLADKESLERFLLRPNVYPLFGKPAESQNSLGSIALASLDGSTGEVIAGNDKRIKVAQLVAEIDAKYAAGYILQEKIHPHPSIVKICGDRLATVRFLTIRAEDGVHVMRACLKIPAGENTADNYWREGNLLARLDLSSGTILSVTSGSGLETKEVKEHPDTKAALIGFAYPEWEAMLDVARKGAAIMRHVPLIGWDIAYSDKGPVIIEMNEYPDAFLMQFSERRGLLDPTFNAFIEFQRRNSTAFDAQMKQRYASM